MLDCLSNIIGLSDTTCGCWDDSKPQNFSELNVSDSGFYLLDPSVVPITTVQAGANCETGSLWDFAINARDRGIKDTINAFVQGINSKFSDRFEPFQQIGDNVSNKAQNVRVGSNYLGVYIEPYRIKGAKIKVNSIDLTFWTGTTPTNIDIEVYDSLNLATPLAVATASVVMDRVKATAVFSTPFEIDLTDIRDDYNQRFYFVYQLPSGFMPVQNKTVIGCNCSAAIVYRDNPYLKVMCKPVGVQSVDVSSLDKPYTVGYMNGLVLNTTFECDYFSWLCDLSTNINNPKVGGRMNLGLALMDAIKARSTAYLLDSILKTKRINYYTMILEEESIHNRVHQQNAIFENAIHLLVEEIPSDISDCLVCKKDFRINKTIKKI